MSATMNFTSAYFNTLTHKINSIEYGKAYGKLHTLHAKYVDAVSTTQIAPILSQLEKEGMSLIKFHQLPRPEELTHWQESFLGKVIVDKNPHKLSYSRLAVKPGSIYLADSNKAQPLHTDEGYTVNVPRYISLFCEKPSLTGGITTLVMLDQIKECFGNVLSEHPLAFNKEALLIESAHEKTNKPLFFYYKKDKIGIAYSTIVKSLKLPLELSPLFMQITDYIHAPSHQIRLKLEKGDLLILDNFRILHGRTSFDNPSSRTFYRFWFSLTDIRKDSFHIKNEKC